MCAMAKTWVNCLYRGILRNPFSTRVNVYPLCIRTADIMMTTWGLIHPMVILPLLMNNSHFPDYNPYSWWLYYYPWFSHDRIQWSYVSEKNYFSVFSSLNDGYVSQTILNPHFPMVCQVFRGEKSHFPRVFWPSHSYRRSPRTTRWPAWRAWRGVARPVRPTARWKNGDPWGSSARWEMGCGKRVCG
jgi:hypothetical protein